VGAGHDLAAVGGADDFPVGFAELRAEFLDQRLHRGKALAIDVHEGDRAALVARDAQDVVHQARREGAAGTHHEDLDGATDVTGQAAGGGILRMRGSSVRDGLFSAHRE